jgi:hypothetical protein
VDGRVQECFGQITFQLDWGHIIFLIFLTFLNLWIFVLLAFNGVKICKREKEMEAVASLYYSSLLKPNTNITRYRLNPNDLKTYP